MPDDITRLYPHGISGDMELMDADGERMPIEIIHDNPDVYLPMRTIGKRRTGEVGFVNVVKIVKRDGGPRIIYNVYHETDMFIRCALGQKLRCCYPDGYTMPGDQRIMQHLLLDGVKMIDSSANLYDLWFMKVVGVTFSTERAAVYDIITDCDDTDVGIAPLNVEAYAGVHTKGRVVFVKNGNEFYKEGT